MESKSVSTHRLFQSTSQRNCLRGLGKTAFDEEQIKREVVAILIQSDGNLQIKRKRLNVLNCGCIKSIFAAIRLV